MPVNKPALARGLCGVALTAVVGFSLVAGAIANPTANAAGQLAAAPATPGPCPVTRPNGQQPPPGEHVFGRGPGGHGTAELWTNLWTWGEGVVLVPPDHVQADGSLSGMKWPWWRGVAGDPRISGRRLDAAAPPPRAEIPGGYGDRGFQPAGLIFPTPGCWEVTGRVGAASLTFVVRVERVNAAGTPLPAALVESTPPAAGR